MKMETDLANQARAAIASAFADVAYPGDQNIVQYTEYLDLERDDIRSYLTGRHWNAVHWPALNNDYPGDTSAILALLSPQGFQFYLPAFLLIALDHFDDADLTALSPFYKMQHWENEPDDIFAWKKERISSLSLPMLDAIELCAAALLELYDSDELRAAKNHIAELKLQRSKES